MPVYFAQSRPGSPIKIGHTCDVSTRLRQLESHYNVPLELLATMPGGREEEAAIHERFAVLRFGKTEQFRPGLGLLAFINREDRWVVQSEWSGPMIPIIRDTGTGLVKLHADVVHSARIVAALQGVPTMDVICDILRPILAEREREALASRLEAAR